MPSVIAYDCNDATTQFHPLQADICGPDEGEIYFDIVYAGICPASYTHLQAPETRR